MQVIFISFQLYCIRPLVVQLQYSVNINEVLTVSLLFILVLAPLNIVIVTSKEGCVY